MFKTIAAFCVIAGIFSAFMPSTEAETLYGVSSTDFLVSFDSTSPNIVDFIDPITGLLGGQTVASLSFNAAMDAVFALGVNTRTGLGNLYQLNLSDGVATPLDPSISLPVTVNPTTIFTSLATGLQYVAATSHGATELFAVDPPTPSLAPLGTFANGAMTLAGVAAVPEPGVLPLLFLGVVGTAIYIRARGLKKIRTSS